MNKIIIWDTEYTSWEGSREREWSEPWEHRELIQLAAIKCDIDDDFNELERINIIIIPKINPKLSDYIQDLTGVTQDVLDANGVSVAEAVADFYEFSEHGKLPLYSYGGDEDVLNETCRINGIEHPFTESSFHDVSRRFANAGIDTSAYSSSTIHQAFNVAMVGQHKVHNALHDVRSIRVALRELTKRTSLPGPF